MRAVVGCSTGKKKLRRFDRRRIFKILKVWIEICMFYLKQVFSNLKCEWIVPDS